MDPKLEQFLVTVVPTIMSIIKDIFKKTGTMPTDAEIIAKLNLDSDRVIAIGEAWLEANK